MPEESYKEALKSGTREVKRCMSRGEYPYLPAMDDFVEETRMTSAVNLGLCNVPTEFIVGTKTRGRSNSFARNWMPVMAPGTEFANKWQSLAKSHVNEGIHDAIKVYEYMNRFYVEEGNKRTSVLRFYGAVTIAAEVIRVLPEKTDEPDVKLYYEFLDFYKISKINFLEFSKPGSYSQFQKLVGKGPEEVWTEDEQRRFKMVYHYFRQAFEALGGKELKSTPGDALLAYMRINGYYSMCEMGAGEMRKAVDKVWEEISLTGEDSPLDVKLDPGETKEVKQNFLSGLLSKPKVMKVAFIHDKNPEDSGWTMGHEKGRRQVQRMMDGKIETTAYFNAMDEDPEAVIRQAIADGNKTIFTTSPQLLPATLRAAVDNSNITMMNCSLNKPHRYIQTYYARMYEVKFIIGAIAGTMTESGRVGYICDYPIFGQIAGINAFAQGVQMTNPNGKVYLEWSSVCGVEEAMRRLEEKHIHMISTQDGSNLRDFRHALFGLTYVRRGKATHLATPVWNWGVYYEKLLRSILNNSLQSDYEESNKALNYYWGMSADVVSLECSDAMPEGAKKLARFLAHGIKSGECSPFYGPLRTQEGAIIDGANHILNLDQIINMNELMDNVIGTIPEYKELDPTGRSTVQMVGVEKIAKTIATAEAEEAAEAAEKNSDAK